MKMSQNREQTLISMAVALSTGSGFDRPSPTDHGCAHLSRVMNNRFMHLAHAPGKRNADEIGQRMERKLADFAFSPQRGGAIDRSHSQDVGRSQVGRSGSQRAHFSKHV